MVGMGIPSVGKPEDGFLKGHHVCRHRADCRMGLLAAGRRIVRHIVLQALITEPLLQNVVRASG